MASPLARTALVLLLTAAAAAMLLSRATATEQSTSAIVPVSHDAIVARHSPGEGAAARHAYRAKLVGTRS